MSTQEKLAKWQAELDRITIVDRWGECRRFHCNKRKIERRLWLIEHISALSAKAPNGTR